MSEVTGNFTIDYLNSRKNFVIDRKKILTNKCKNNEKQIKDLDLKIHEIESQYDEAYEIFSPKPRNSETSKTEMAVLAQKQVDLTKEIKNMKAEIEDLIVEEGKIDTCLKLIANGEVFSKAINEFGFVTHVYLDEINMIHNFSSALDDFMNKLNHGINDILKSPQYLSRMNDLVKESSENLYQAIREYSYLTIEDNLEDAIDTYVSNLNRTYNDRIAAIYEPCEKEITYLTRSEIYRIICATLNGLLPITKKNILLRLSYKANYMMISFELSSTESVDIAQIKELSVNQLSPLTVDDILSIAHGKCVKITDDDILKFIFSIAI